MMDHVETGTQAQTKTNASSLDAQYPDLVEEPDGQYALAVESDHAINAEEMHQALVNVDEPLDSSSAPQLRRVWLENFKGYSKFEVALGRFNVVVGANNAGKSTLLQAIDLLYSLLKIHADHSSLSAGGRLLPPTILPVATLRDLFYNGITRVGNNNVRVIIGAEFSDGSLVSFSIRALFGNANSRVESQVGMEGVRLLALLGKPAVWVPSAVGIVRDEEYRTAARQVGLINAGRHNEVLRNLLNTLSREKPDRYSTLQRILSDRFAARLDGVSFDETLDQFVSAGYSDDTGARHDLYSAGAGFIQVVQLLAFILIRQSSVVLLDEPDAHLHSGLQRVVVEILEEVAADQNYQVVLATHSKEIINFVDPSRLVFVSDGAESAAPASAEVTPITILQSLGAIDNVDAFTLLKNRRCLFIEGKTDRTVLGRFAAAIDIHTFTGDGRVVCVPVRGADKFEHIRQLDVFEALLGGKIQSLEIRDRDARTDALRASLMESTPRPLHVLELDCIESYLLVPKVVARVVVDVAADRGREINCTPDEIETLLLELSAEMRDATIDRISGRFISGTGLNPAMSIAQGNTEARGALANSWGSLSARLRYVSGKELLGKMRQSLQISHGVTFGNERLAESFAPDEIAEEIKEQLKRTEDLQSAPNLD